MNIWIAKLEESVFFSKDFRFGRAHMLTDSLIKNKHSITFFSSNPTSHIHNKEERKFLKKKKIKYIFLPSRFYNYYKFSYFFKVLSEFYQSYKLNEEIKKLTEKPDVIITSIPSIIISKVLTKYAILNRIKLIVDCRDLHPDIFYKELPVLLRIISIPLILKFKYDLSFICDHSHSLIGINKFFVNHLKKYRNKKTKINTRVFPISYKPNRSLLLKKSKIMKLEKSKFKIIFFGTINKTFFLAYKKFFENYFYSSDVFFYFAGQGRYINKFLLDIRDKKNLIYLGNISQSSMIKNYSQFDAFIYLMDNRLDYLNSLPNKFFEAIFFRLPIVTFNRGLPKKVLELYKLGFYCKSYKFLLNNLTSLKIRKYENNRMIFLKKYSYEKIYSNFSKYIETI